MNPSLALVTDGRPSSWPAKTMSPDAASWSAMVLPSPSPTETVWRAPFMAVSAQADHISPVSSGLDLSMDGSSAPTTANSTSSSCTDSWSIGYVDRDDADDDDDDDDASDDLDRGTDDGRTVPKLEPMDDHVDLSDMGIAPCPSSALQSPVCGGPLVKQKRPRGRPRKNSSTAPTGPATKVTKGRSKTGCITCRKRKKKCDEAKPRCMNCEKNAVVCEGYHEKQLWRSGRERAEEERLRLELPTVTLQPIFKGVETREDWIFWRHYVNHFSNVLTVEGEAKNAFKDVILQLANQHQGLMHSVLALSSKHIDLGSPYGMRILQENPATSRESLEQRAGFHHGEALKRLYEDIEKPVAKDDPEYQTILAARYGQILCLLLRTRAEGNPRGEHRLHLQAYQSLISQSPPEDTAFYTFITEFFQYHVFTDDLFWHPESSARRLSSESWQPPMPMEAPRLLGVADGLFKHLSQITDMRNKIRENMAVFREPLVDYTTLSRAVDIDTAIREWCPRWPPGDGRDRVVPLYKQMMWVYLFRTIYPPATRLPRRSTLGALPATPPTPAPQRRASTAASLRYGAAAAKATAGGSPPGPAVAKAPPSQPRKPSRTSSMHELDSRAAAGPTAGHESPGPSSPAPPRCPPHDVLRITLAVEESLFILESLKPSDPCQTLLLMPCLIIGTSCFEAAQRSRIRTVVRLVRGYTGLRNCDRVSEVLERVWALMDEGDWVSVWDWQGVARHMGLDFLCA